MDFFDLDSSRAYLRDTPVSDGVTAVTGLSVMRVAVMSTLVVAGRQNSMVEDTIENTRGTHGNGAAKVIDHLYSGIIAQRWNGAGSRRHGGAGRSLTAPRRLLLALVIALAAAGTACSLAQEIPARRAAGGLVLEAEAAARLLGLVASGDGTSLTLRSAKGILTLFDGSPDVVWQPHDAVAASEGSLSAPVDGGEGGWWLPADAFGYFDLWVHDGVVEGADGLSVDLAIPPAASFQGREGELVDLGQGVPGLRLYAAGRGGAASLSLLLADAGLLGLAMPNERTRFDELVDQAGRDHALIMVLTSRVDESWSGAITFSQGAREVEARHPFRLRLLAGEPGRVGPESPAVGVVLLPEGFNLREPITVVWASARATITFRR